MGSGEKAVSHQVVLTCSSGHISGALDVWTEHFLRLHDEVELVEVVRVPNFIPIFRLDPNEKSGRWPADCGEVSLGRMYERWLALGEVEVIHFMLHASCGLFGCSCSSVREQVAQLEDLHWLLDERLEPERALEWYYWQPNECGCFGRFWPRASAPAGSLWPV